MNSLLTGISRLESVRASATRWSFWKVMLTVVALIVAILFLSKPNSSLIHRPREVSAVPHMLAQAEALENRDPKASVELAEHALAMAKRSGDALGTIESSALLGRFLWSSGDDVRAETYTIEAKRMNAPRRSSKAAGVILCMEGIIHERAARYNAAIEAAFGAVKIFEEIKDDHRLCDALLVLGNIQVRLQRCSEAKVHCLRAQDLYRNQGDFIGVGRTLVSLGSLARGEGQFELAMDYYRQAETTYREVNYPRALGKVYNNMGVILSTIGQFDQALLQYRKSLEIQERVGNQLDQGRIHYNIADILLRSKRYHESLVSLKRAQTLLKNAGFRQMLVDSYKLECSLMKAMGNSRDALALFEKYHAEKAEILSMTLAGKIDSLKAKHESERQVKEIQILKMEGALKRSRIRTITIIAGLFAIAAVLLAVQYRDISKAQRIIKSKNRDLEALDAIVSRLNKEIEISKVLDSILANVMVLFESATRVRLYLASADENHLACAAARTIDIGKMAASVFPMVPFVGLCRNYVQNETNSASIHDHWQNQTGVADLPDSLSPPLSTLTICLADHSVRAVIILENTDRPAAFSGQDAERLERIRPHAASAVSKAHLLTRIQRERNRAEAALSELIQTTAELTSNKQIVEERARHLEAANRALGEMIQQKDAFLQMVSHDIRNPLANVTLAADMIEDADDHEEICRLAKDIHLECLDMQNLVKRFLDTAALEEGRITPEIVDLEPMTLVQKSIQSLEPHARSKGVNLVADSSSSDMRIQVDIQLTKEILDNLLSNAIKFSPPGSDVSVEARRDKNDVVIVVKDSGPGIPLSEQGQLFKRFQRLSTKPTGGEKSTGLGLYIVKHLVELQGGQVDYIGAPQKGSTFFVRFPASVMMHPISLSSE